MLAYSAYFLGFFKYWLFFTVVSRKPAFSRKIFRVLAALRPER
jgi:hypothetical protein